MSRKHNTKHEERGTSNYPFRARIFSIGGSRQMEGLETLRNRQNRRIKNTCTLHEVHVATDDARDCNGQAWYTGEGIESMVDAA
jgi:hypothetical protein